MKCVDVTFGVPEAIASTPAANDQSILDRVLQGVDYQKKELQALRNEHVALQDHLKQQYVAIQEKLSSSYENLQKEIRCISPVANPGKSEASETLEVPLVPLGNHVQRPSPRNVDASRSIPVCTHQLGTKLHPGKSLWQAVPLGYGHTGRVDIPDCVSEKKPSPASSPVISKAAVSLKLPVSWTFKTPDPRTARTATWGATRVLLGRWVMSDRFEFFAGVLILIDICVLVAQSEWQSRGVGVDFGWRSSDQGWSSVKIVFDVIQFVIAGIFSAELILRIYVFRWAMFTKPLNMLDMVLIPVVSINVFLLRPLGAEDFGRKEISLGRFLRIFKSFRILRLIRLSNRFTELRVILRTMCRCAYGLLWSTVIIAGIILANALLLTQISLTLINDESYDIEVRRWLYDKCGSVSKAWLVLFESTFSSLWVTYSSKFIHEVHGLFAAFWIYFVVAVNFMMLRIIAALFLRQVMDISANDAEKQAMAKMQEREKYAYFVEEIFKHGDTSGDGVISKEEFHAMKKVPEVQKCFRGLDLDDDEVDALFAMLCIDDGVADFYEFLHSALKMKSTARTLDAMQIMHGQLKIQQSLEALQIKFEEEFHPKKIPNWLRICGTHIGSECAPPNRDAHFCATE